MDSSDSPIICGDFNVCGQREKTTKIPRFLASLGLTQLVDGATQIQGRQIHHIYVREDMKTDVLAIERCSLYYSDHDALLLTLNIQVAINIVGKVLNLVFQDEEDNMN